MVPFLGYIYIYTCSDVHCTYYILLRLRDKILTYLETGALAWLYIAPVTYLLIAGTNPQQNPDISCGGGSCRGHS